MLDMIHLSSGPAAPFAAFHAETAHGRHRRLAMREKPTCASGIDVLMHEFSLSSEEGVALMCVAEAVCRYPII